MSTKIYDKDGVTVTVYVGPAGPEDRRRVSILFEAEGGAG